MVASNHPDYKLLEDFYNNHIGEVGKPFADTEDWQKERLYKSSRFAWFKLHKLADAFWRNIIKRTK